MWRIDDSALTSTTCDNTNKEGNIMSEFKSVPDTTPNLRPSAASRRKHKESISMGIILVAIGSFFLLDRLDFINARDYFQYWPALIALSGVICVVSAERTSEVLSGLFQIAVAAWLYAVTQHLYGLTFFNSWPLIVIAAGLNMVIRYFVEKSNH
jgi:hypothetical protein